jgi:3-oxoacyl-[acyl-carrier protein] reductase
MPASTERKTALVTGAAGVMGRAAVKALLDDGCRVVLADLSEQGLREAAAEFEAETILLPLDVSDAGQVERSLAGLEKELGGIDILLNNAGVLSNNKSQATRPEEWRRVLAVNLDGIFYLSRAVIPGMKQKGWGRIINVTSVAAKTGGITAGTAYSTSKGGVISLTFSLAAETAPYGITVNAVAPAYVKTPMITEQLSEEARQAVLKKIPVGRFCEPEEFAHVVSFLASPLAGFITGEVIDLNGGIHFD